MFTDDQDDNSSSFLDLLPLAIKLYLQQTPPTTTKALSTPRTGWSKKYKTLPSYQEIVKHVNESGVFNQM